MLLLAQASKVGSLVIQGRWAEATELACAVLNSSNAQPRARCNALAPLGLIRARRGEHDARAALDEARDLLGTMPGLPQLCPVAAARAEAAWLVGDMEAVRREASDAFDLAVRQADPWGIGELGFWMWRAGAIDSPPPGAARPYALQIAGDWAATAAEWDKLACPYEGAMARAEQRDEGALRAALQTLDALGARPAVDMVRSRLRSLGVHRIPRGPRPSTRANPARLTRREDEVLEMVAGGLRNSEIATRLHLSAKTVDHHVGAILGKLGVRSRAEAVSEAERLGLATQYGERAGPT
jgi:DNA-binding CsgD family transcriptional regulator